MDAICRCLATRDPRTPYPGLSLLLLYRFAPITADDDAEAIRGVVAEAWRALGLFTDDEIARLIGRTRWAKSLRWTRDPERGWVVAQAGDDAYSMRWPDNESFPFLPLRDLVQQAHACAGDADGRT